MGIEVLLSFLAQTLYKMSVLMGNDKVAPWKSRFYHHILLKPCIKMTIWIENDKLTDRKPCHFTRIAGKIQGLPEINAKLWVLQERTLSKQLI